LPRNIARRLGLWPPPRGAEELTYRTAGGPLRVWLLPRGARVSVVAEDKPSGEVECDVVISPLAGEALISDKLIDALGIVLEVPGRGLWRFRSDPQIRLGKVSSQSRDSFDAIAAPARGCFVLAGSPLIYLVLVIYRSMSNTLGRSCCHRC